MFTLKVNNQLISHCEKTISQYNFGQRNQANGDKEQQLTGIIGQSVVMELFGLGYVDGKQGFDDGVDILFNGQRIDVKTMGRKTNVRLNYTNNFLKLQDYFKTDIYIFCSYHKIKQEVTICGWIDKKGFTLKRRFYPKGSIRTRQDKTTFTTFSDLYEIDNKDLNQVEGFEDMKLQIKNF